MRKTRRHAIAISGNSSAALACTWREFCAFSAPKFGRFSREFRVILREDRRDFGMQCAQKGQACSKRSPAVCRAILDAFVHLWRACAARLAGKLWKFSKKIARVCGEKSEFLWRQTCAEAGNHAQDAQACDCNFWQQQRSSRLHAARVLRIFGAEIRQIFA